MIKPIWKRKRSENYEKKVNWIKKGKQLNKGKKIRLVSSGFNEFDIICLSRINFSLMEMIGSCYKWYINFIFNIFAKLTNHLTLNEEE